MRYLIRYAIDPGDGVFIDRQSVEVDETEVGVFFNRLTAQGFVVTSIIYLGV